MVPKRKFGGGCGRRRLHLQLQVAKYDLHLVALQGVRLGKRGSESAYYYTFVIGNGNADHHLSTGFFIHQIIGSSIKRVKFISDRMPYVTLRGRWCDIAQNVHAPTEDKSDETKDSFYEELERIIGQFAKNHVKFC
jgi:hypothetical protein